MSENFSPGPLWRPHGPNFWEYVPDNAPVGFVELHDNGDHWLLGMLYVYAAYRRQNYGSIMLTAMTSLDSRPVRLIVESSLDSGAMTNRQLKAWYRKFGFKQVTGTPRQSLHVTMQYTPEGF